MSTTSLPLLIGSSRQDGNAAGLASWLTWRFNMVSQSHPDSAPRSHLRLATQLLPNLPSGPVLDPTMAALIASPENYQDPAVREWSALVRSSPAIVILTPQYNWGYPGNLKNFIDHLYHEWTDKSVIIITYGGHGGSKCAEQLSQVLVGGVKAKLVSQPVMITLPREYIRSTARVPVKLDEQSQEIENVPSWLEAYQGAMDQVIEEAYRAIHVDSSPSGENVVS